MQGAYPEAVYFTDATGRLQTSTRAGRRNKLEELTDLESASQSFPPVSQERAERLADFHQKDYDLQKEKEQVIDHLGDVVQNLTVIMDDQDHVIIDQNRVIIGLRQDLQQTVNMDLRTRRRLEWAYLGMQRLRVVFFWFLSILQMLEIQIRGERQENLRAQQEIQQAQQEKAALEEKLEKERHENERLQKQIDDLMKKNHSKTDGSKTNNNSDDHCNGGCGPSCS